MHHTCKSAMSADGLPVHGTSVPVLTPYWYGNASVPEASAPGPRPCSAVRIAYVHGTYVPVLTARDTCMSCRPGHWGRRRRRRSSGTRDHRGAVWR